MASFGMTAFNCTQFPDVQPNPDISGIGVLCGFLVTAYLTLFCCVTKLLFDHKRAKANTSSTTKEKLERWSSALNDTIVSFSDQQIVTGISIVVGGLSQLQWGISSYHWQAVVNLAWFSTVTHLITLTVLRDQKPSDVHLKSLRAAGMGVLMVLLLCAMGPVGYLTNGEIPEAFPAWCLYHPSLTWDDLNGTRLQKTYNSIYICLANGLIVFSFATRVVLLFSERTSIDHMIFGSRSDEPWTYLEEYMNRRKVLRLFYKSKVLKSLILVEYKVLRSLNTLLVAGGDLYSSKVWEITWLSIALAWGTIRIFVTRGDSLDKRLPPTNIPSDVLAQQNVWGFGQVVALGILILPLISFYEKLRKDTSNSSHSAPQQAPIQSNLMSNTTGQAVAPGLSDFRTQLYSNTWYSKLLILWYLLSVAFAADLLYTTPATNGASTLLQKTSVLESVLIYFVWILLDIAILWISTLIFSDEDLQAVWNSQELGRFLNSNKTFSVLAWAFVILVLLDASLSYDVMEYFRYMPGLNK